MLSACPEHRNSRFRPPRPSPGQQGVPVLPGQLDAGARERFGLQPLARLGVEGDADGGPARSGADRGAFLLSSTMPAKS